MCHTALPVAKLFVEYSRSVKEIVKKQVDQAPFYERDIEPFEAFGAESPGIVDRFLREEVACSNKKEGHVERVKKSVDYSRGFGMAYHHQDDAYGLTY